MDLSSLSETVRLDHERIRKGLKGKTESQGGLSVKDLKVIAETLGVEGKTRRDLEQVIRGKLGLPEDAPVIKSKLTKLSKMQLNSDLVDAIVICDIEKVKTLIDLGADVNSKEQAVIMAAVDYGDPEILKLLIDNGASQQSLNEALIYAAYCSFHGANQQSLNEALIYAAYCSFHEAIKVLLNAAGITQATKDKALYFAVKNNSLYIAQLLLEHGANIQANNNKLLFELINTISDDFITERLKFVLATGGDVHLQDEKILLVAVKKNKLNAVMVLLERGATITENIIRKAPSEEMRDLLLHPENYVNLWEAEGHVKSV